jgi:hypothetical protein
MGLTQFVILIASTPPPANVVVSHHLVAVRYFVYWDVWLLRGGLPHWTPISRPGSSNNLLSNSLF